MMGLLACNLRRVRDFTLAAMSRDSLSSVEGAC